MNRNNVFLVGFMGSGKTALYKEISPLVNVENFDLDEEITKNYGSIEEIFEKEGESQFRLLEQKEFSSIPDENCLVALGGGSIENDIIFDKITSSSNAFYLMDNIENLWERIKDSDRPLVKRGKDEVIKLFNKRQSLYEKVLNKIDMSKTTINEASEIVIESTWLKDARI
tara:strand:- start:1792 stop:2301 length:510 start_codon:yes stop_codon:yes gene_type:complete